MRLVRGPLLVCAFLLFATPSAQAAFHLIKVSEVFPGTTSNVDTAFVELQMFQPGQNFVAAHEVDYYTQSGTLLGSYRFPANVANGEDQRKILIGDTQAGGNPDFTVDQLGDALHPGTSGGGAVCFPDAEPPDCVSWGGFTPPPGFPNAQAANAPLISDGSSLTRSTAPGCSNLLEPADDTDSSATDFALTAPNPENNSAALPGPCQTTGDDDPPETSIDKVKANKKKDKVKVKFSADEPGAEFECKRDKKKWKPCDSPKKYKKLDDGKHKVRVRATDEAGNTDPTPAKARFKV